VGRLGLHGLEIDIGFENTDRGVEMIELDQLLLHDRGKVIDLAGQLGPLAQEAAQECSFSLTMRPRANSRPTAGN